MKSIKSTRTFISETFSVLLKLNERLDDIRINQGLILSEIHATKGGTNINEFEYKVFSQWGEDGIIQRLIKVLEIKNKTFIEFGVEDFTESNCRFLLMKDNWSGFVIDGSSENINKLRKSYYYWRYKLNSLDRFITSDNINDLLTVSGFDSDVGILSVDLDGNDYYILEAITDLRPRILICEYNAVFGSSRKISVPYDPSFHRTTKHHSNLYFGASLAAITHLANNRGYSLVGTNTAANNAFYVRNDLINFHVEVLSVEKAFHESHARESRDSEGNLTFVSGPERIKLIAGLPVFNVETQTLEVL